MKIKDIPPFSWFKHKKEEDKKRKKRILLWTIFPLSLLGLGGITVGTLVGTGILRFSDSSKIELKDAFGFSGDEVDYEGGTPQTIEIDKAFVSNWLMNLATSNNCKHVMNDIEWTQVPVWTYGEPDSATGIKNTVKIEAKPTSKEFEGDLTINFWLKASVRSISQDISSATKLIDLSANGNPSNISGLDLLGILKVDNPNLNTNAISIAYGSSSSYTTYDGSFGSGNSTSITNFWSSTDDAYTFMLVPKSNWSYYAGSDPVNYKLKLYRDPISGLANWKTIAFDAFFTEPSATQLTTEFELKYASQAWWDDFVGSSGDNTQSIYGFSDDTMDTTNHKAYFSYKGSPFYASVTGSDSIAYTEFSYTVGQQTPLNSGVFKTSDGAEINSLNNYFVATPIPIDVIDVLCTINSALKTSVYWTQLNITITPTQGTPTQGVIKIEPVTNSLFYSGSKEITYTLKTS